MALATPAQLAHVFALDLWRAARAGQDEQFDADRFGVWLEVLVDVGAVVAADKLAGMDVDLVVAGLAQHVRVFDVASVTPFTSTDGEEFVGVRPDGDGPGCDIGGYRVMARRTDAWDAIVSALEALGAEHPEFFRAVMRGCRRLSNSAPEIDGLHDVLTDREQAMFDVALDREGRREAQGYVTPAQARAFLDMSRTLPLGHRRAPPIPNPIARAYFRAVESAAAPDAGSERRLLPAESVAPAAGDHAAVAVAALVEVLHDAGVFKRQQPRALLDEPRNRSRLALIHAQMAFAHDRDPVAHSTRTSELGYLANTLIAGCSIQARPFTIREASDAAVAVCNLGLENWPDAAGLPRDFLVSHDLIGVFQVGWTVLHDDVCMNAVGQLIDVLSALRCDDREIQSGLDTLRLEMTRRARAGTPWLARDALDVIAILDMPAWAALLGLIDECPVIHAGIGASLRAGTREVSPSAFEFVSENSQIAVIRQFLQLLPGILHG